MTVKIDLEKAYDSLNLSYIRACLSRFGFCNSWIDLIMNCMVNMSFFILINGKSNGHFQPKQGHSQRDPLSHIFIVCMESSIKHLKLPTLKSKNHVGL